jgi:hypothetical protein
MTVWAKVAVALIPLALAALVGIAWSNSHAMGVQAALITRLTYDIEQIERRLEGCK